MEFFYRVFCAVEKNIWAEEIDAFLEKTGLGLNMMGVVEEEDENDPNAVPVCLIFTDDKDREVASLVYDKLEDSDFLGEELEEFQGLINEMGPEANRAWVSEKLEKTVGCYAFEIADAGFESENWDKLAALAEWLRTETEGIEQSDGGQITNENGAVVLVVPNDYDPDEYADDDEDGEDDEELVEGELASDDEEEFEEIDEDDEEEDEPWESFTAAMRNGDSWDEKAIESEEDLDAFINGEF